MTGFEQTFRMKNDPRALRSKENKTGFPLSPRKACAF